VPAAPTTGAGSAGAAAGPGADAQLDPRRWRALTACMTALFMTLIDATIVNVALPSIQKSTGAAASELQWVVSGYALAFGMVPIIGGRLGDDRGRRRMLLIGLGGFVVMSAVVGFSPSPAILIGARLLQGVAGGLVNPQVSGIIQNLFPPRERGRAFGYLGANVGAATALGPVLGGAIIALGGERIGWRLCFLVNVPVGLGSMYFVHRWLPVSTRKMTPQNLDLPGVGLLAVGLFGVLFPLVEYDSDRNPLLAVALIPAAAVLTCFYLWERGPARRRGHPLIDTGLFRIRSYADGVLIALVYFCGFSGLPLVLSLFLQEGLGFAALASGLTASAFALGTVISAPIGGRLVPRFGRRLMVAALALFSIGVAGAAVAGHLTAGRVAGHDLAFALAVPLFVAGFGGGCVITPNQALSLAEIDARGGSTAGGMLQTSQRVGSAIGAAVLSAVFYTVAAGYIHSTGSARAAGYGNAYVLALVVTVGFGLVSLALAIKDSRARAPRPA
jgi:EmrB/QacA subfamily drug resistance transporter